MEATFIGFRMWAQAVVQAGTTDVDAVRQAMYRQRIKAPSGFEEVMNTNHHLSKPVMIGKVDASGTFDVIWQSINPVRADAWSKYIPDSAKRTADWTFPWVCGGLYRADIQGMVMVGLLDFPTHTARKRLQWQNERVADRRCGAGTLQAALCAAQTTITSKGVVLTLRNLVSLAALSIGLLTVAACSVPEREPAVPQADTARAMPLGIPNARFYADGDPKPVIEEGMRALEREEAAQQVAGKAGPSQAGTQLPPVSFLAVSGGGDNGAFGAGLMNGWTEAGTRPDFKMVTGISTGALTAPFAFLGPDYDAVLREVYTSMTPEKVYRPRRLLAALFDDAMADTSPLAEVIVRYADQKMFDAIAREYQKGRLLMIGTTDLDAQRPVIWNIGAIAASGHPDGLALFRKILRASAAIPGAFPPVLVDVEIDGKKYQEMHVDGGTMAQLFLYPASVDLSRSGVRRVRHAYIIRNARLDPDYSANERRTISIAGRAINTMLASSGKNDVLRTYFVSQRDGVDYNLAYIGSDFKAPKTGEFDQAYMNALYQYGYQQAKGGQAWHKTPPSLETPAMVPVKP